MPGKHQPASGDVFRSQCSSRNSAGFRCSRDSGEVSARCAIDSRACV
jgi:hypothetical protein